MDEEKTEKDDDILKEAKERAALCQEYYSDEYDRGHEDVKFGMLGDQWPEKIKEDRERSGRPCLVENRCHTSILQVINSIRQSRPAIQVNPVNDQADVETAKILKGIVRNIETQSAADNVYDTAALCAVSAGYGWIRVITDYVDNEGFDQEIKLLRVPDFSSVMLDPNSKELDGSDAEYGFVFTDIEKEAFERQYPDEEAVSAEGYDQKSKWCTDKTVRIAEYFKKVYKKKTIVLTEQGVMSQEDANDLGLAVLQEREVQVPSIKWYKLTGNAVLETTDWLGKYIPLIPVYGEEVVVDGRRKFFSLVTQAKDPQRRYNYWLTASTEIIALQPRAPFIGITGQFKSAARKWATANRENHAFIEADPVELPDGTYAAIPPQRQPPPQGSPAMFQEMMAAAEGIKSTLGIFDASLGAGGNEKSGKAILARQAQGDNSTFHFVDNLQTSIRHVGRVLIDLIPKITNGPQIMRINGEDDTKSQVPVNQPVIRNGNDYISAPVGSIPDAFFDLNLGKYDVVATVGPSYVSRRRETAEMLQSLMTAIPEAATVCGDIFVKNLDIPEADVVVERLRKMNPLLSDKKDQNAEQLQKAGDAIKALQTQIDQMGAALDAKREKDEAEKQAEIAKNLASVEKLRAETQKITAETAQIAATMPSGLTTEHITEIIRTIAQIETELRDTADAVDVLLSHGEAQQGTLPPDPTQMQQKEQINA